jgi:hypothetical protein
MSARAGSTGAFLAGLLLLAMPALDLVVRGKGLADIGAVHAILVSFGLMLVMAALGGRAAGGRAR